MDLATDLLRDALDAASGRFEHADARHVRRRSQQVTMRNGEVERIDDHTDEGVGLRVRAAGSWGFAATADVSGAGIEGALRAALAFAEALPPSSVAGPLAPEPVHHFAAQEPGGTDPLTVPLSEKLALLSEADAGMAAEPAVAVRLGHLDAGVEERALVTGTGTAVTERHVETGGGISAIAIRDGEVQVRSHPGSFRGLHARRGWELIAELELAAQAPRVAAEAAALLDAPPCPAMTTTVILDGEQAALQLHESIGHAVELDRILGFEASYAGTSWVPLGAIGSLRYGSELLGVTADATMPGGLGTFRVDDEGVGARALPIVRGGILVGTLSSRETAAATGLARSGGCMRAEGWRAQPIVRMTNVNLDPAPPGAPEGSGGSLEELIAATDEGLLLSTNRSWSIDDRRLNFQFGTEAAWEIRGGRLGRMLRNPSYADTTPRFWSSLDGLCGPGERVAWGVVNCGKGEPGQVARVSHATVPCRFAGVPVGTAG